MQHSRIALQFGAVIRRHRLLAKLSQEEFADRCSLHRTYIGAIERGEKTVTIETARKLAEALNVKLSELIVEIE